MIDIDPSLTGRLSFKPDPAAVLTKPPLPPGRHALGIAEIRDAFLYVPDGIDPAVPVPLVVLFHGAGGSARRIMPVLEEHAERHRFLLLGPQSLLPTWDIVIGGSGPDRERLELALAEVAARYRLDPTHIGFAGHSDGGSMSLTMGLTNGGFVTHIMAMSAGFMAVLMPEGEPRVFIAHGAADEQLPVATSGRANATRLKEAGYDVTYLEFNGPHAVQPTIAGIAVRFFVRDLLGV
ncbi:hypothetical protein [Azospirillum sp. SYSU D00513]|uniref:alpha/beta hydrolase n=1 Tax=Azospirillum sp. SYSU D00513 TaxID=2812561 RepID=UPI001A95D90E|nr:hypothetical protein [Azospirillum sp. SYSU D00513]